MTPKNHTRQPQTTNHKQNSIPAGLYIHVPFCCFKCPYCDFYSITDLEQIESYLDALIQEMELRQNDVAFADTIYFGGGTPSVLAPEQIQRILDHVYGCFSIASDVEVTLEVNPGTVDKNALSAYRAIGINRLNIGLQSLNEESLRFLGRIHSARQGVETYHWARNAGFKNVGLDLIYGLPGQNWSFWKKELNDVLQLAPDHLSCYTLTLETGTPMAEMVDRGEIRFPEDQSTGDLFSLTTTYLNGNGYSQYEISNFARNADGNSVDFQSRHNRKYWNFSSYLGLGPAAHSYQDYSRWWNHRSVSAYLENLRRGKLPIEGSETLTREQQMIEFVYLGLRQKVGINANDFQLRFGTDFFGLMRPGLTLLMNEGMVETTSAGVRLSDRGMRFHESIVNGLIGERDLD